MDTTKLAATSNQPININVDIGTLAKGSSIALFAKVAGRGLQLIVYVILARSLGPANYGLYALGLTVLQLGQQIGLLGLDNAVIQFGARALQRGTKELSAVLQQVQFLALGSGVLIGGGIYILAPWLATNIFRHQELANILRGFSITAVFAIELRVLSAATRISRRMQFSALSEDIIPVAVSLILVLVLVVGARLTTQGAVLAVTAGLGVGGLLALYFLRKLFHTKLVLWSFTPGLSKELLSFSLPTFLAGIFGLMLQGSSIFLIGYFLSPKDVGIYQAAAQISIVSAIILTAFNAIFAPMIPGLHQAGQMKQLDELFKVSTKWGLYISLPYFLIVVLMPGQVLTVVYGQQYVSGALPLMILALAQLINTGTGAVGYLLIMTNHNKRWLLIAGFSWVNTILLSLWLVPSYGIIGGAIATGCGVVTMFLAGVFEVRRQLGLWPYDRRYTKGCLAALVTAMTIVVVKGEWHDPSTLVLIGLLIASITIFWGTMTILGFENEEKGFVSSFRSRLLSAWIR